MGRQGQEDMLIMQPHLFDVILLKASQLIVHWLNHINCMSTLGRLNWWTSTGRLPRLEPLATSGDGNCLLHAASLYMWGIHDHLLILRTALHRLLTVGVEKDGLKRRWKYQTQLRNDQAGGLTFTEEEWEFEWGEILRIATNKPRRQPTTGSLRRYSSLRLSYESLEEIHIFVLANTIRRPIIVIADRTIKDMSGEDLAPIYFGGIYLPLEVNPTTCCKSPVVLAYDSSHFSALVAKQDGQQDKPHLPRFKLARMNSVRMEPVIPLVTPDGSLLPVQFIYDPKKRDVQEKWSKMEYEVGEFPDDVIRLLENYLNVRWIQLKVSSTSTEGGQDRNFPIQVPKVRFPAASIVQDPQPVYQKELVEKYLTHIRARFQEEKELKAQWQAKQEEQERIRLQNVTVPCEGEGCDMFGRAATNNLCSVCYQKMLLAKEGGGEVASRELSPDQDLVNLHREIGGGTQRLDPTQEAVGSGHNSTSREPTPTRSGEPAVNVASAVGKLRRSKSPDENSQTAASKLKRSKSPDESSESAVGKLKRSKSPDENSRIKSSRSPSKSPPPPKAAPPTPASKTTKGAPPTPHKEATDVSKSVDTGSVANTAPTTSGSNNKRATLPSDSPSHRVTSPNKWISNLVPPFLKKTPKNPASKTGYARDNILPLHLEQTAQENAGGSSSGGGGNGDITTMSTGSNKQKCKTANCDFYSSPQTAGYCSECCKLVENNDTMV